MAGQMNFKTFYIGLGVLAVAGGAAMWMASARSGNDGAQILEAPVPVGTAAFAGYVIGSDSAPVEIVEYADFQCPACARVAIMSGPDIHRRLVQEGLVRWRFRDFLGHNLSALAHHAAACANDQGQFWEMHDQLFYRQREWATSTRPMRSFEKYAGAVGLDMSQYGQCMDEGRHAARLKATHEQIVTSGIGSTPTFDISGQVTLRHIGVIPYDSLRVLVDVAAGTSPQ